MRITFVNHASFIIEHNEIKLLCDPWMEGPAFDNGWKLHTQTKMNYEDYGQITHIWFSHEHPDHFSPPNLMKISPVDRKRITVLYQKTIDKKVIEFCNKAGFKEQIELPPNELFALSKEFEILCTPYTYGDAYAYFKINDIAILNLNDCVVDSSELAFDLKEKIGKVDILFTQFGYANKVGNENDLNLRIEASKEKLERIAFQQKALLPKVIVPFASYIYFCHEENSYMNYGAQKIRDVYDFIQQALDTKCCVLYPGDEFTFDSPSESINAIELYEKDIEKALEGEYIKSDSIEINLLKKASVDFCQKLMEGYPKQSYGIGRLTANIYLSDYSRSFLFSGQKGLIENNLENKKCDIILTSNALLYVFQNLWGLDTLQINGRYQTNSKGFWSFGQFGAIATHLNRKEAFPFDYVPGLEVEPSLKSKVIGKIKRIFN